MKTTGIFETYRYTIPFKTYNEPIYLIPFGDIHRSSTMCAVDKWMEFLEWASKKPNCYFLGMGDYDDLASTSERYLLQDRALHESTIQTIEDLYMKNTLRLAKELSFMKGKLVGLIEGNHYGEFQNGTTTTQKLAELLGCKYLGVSGFVRLAFEKKVGNKTINASIDLWAHHGLGASRLVGGSLNRVQQMLEAADSDLYLMGHDHKKSLGMTSRLYLTNGNGSVKLRHRKVLFGRTGSFLNAYESGKVSYIVDSAMSPTDLGTLKIELTPKRENETVGGKNINDHIYIDVHGSI